MKTNAVVWIKSDKSLTPNFTKDMESASKTTEIYLFKRIRDAKTFFNQEVTDIEKMLFNLPFKKIEDEVEDFHVITYTYSFGGTEYTKEINFKKGD